jgi:hypothetical protein
MGPSFKEKWQAFWAGIFNPAMAGAFVVSICLGGLSLYAVFTLTNQQPILQSTGGNVAVKSYLEGAEKTEILTNVYKANPQNILESVNQDTVFTGSESTIRTASALPVTKKYNYFITKQHIITDQNDVC